MFDSLFATLVSVLPACVTVFRKPDARNLLLSTTNCAWGFFLFSFQVHEKSVLLPLVPSSLLLLGVTDPSWISYINIVAGFSLWPLCKKDGLQLQYLVYNTFWIWFAGFWRITRATSITRRIFQLVQIGTYLAILILHTTENLIEIEDKPDLSVVLNVLLCAPCFGFFYLLTLAELLGFRMIDQL